MVVIAGHRASAYHAAPAPAHAISTIQHTPSASAIQPLLPPLRTLRLCARYTVSIHANPKRHRALLDTAVAATKDTIMVSEANHLTDITMQRHAMRPRISITCADITCHSRYARNAPAQPGSTQTGPGRVDFRVGGQYSILYSRLFHALSRPDQTGLRRPVWSGTYLD